MKMQVQFSQTLECKISKNEIRQREGTRKQVKNRWTQAK